MDIRALTRTEIRVFAPRMVELLRENFARPPHNLDLPEAQATKMIREVVGDPHSLVIAAFDGDALVYFTASRPFNRVFPFGHKLSPWLKKIGANTSLVLFTPYSAIAASHRGKAIAPAASRVLDQEIRRCGYTMRIIAIVVGQGGGDRSQHTFFEKIGYRKAGVTDTERDDGLRVRFYFKENTP